MDILIPNNIRNLILLTTNYTLISANNFKYYFDNININTEIIVNNVITEKIIESLKNNYYLFLLGITHIRNINVIDLPKNKYIIYQIEQLNQIENEYNNLSDEVINLMKNCYKLFDYSTVNILYYPLELRNKIEILSPLIINKDINKNIKEFKELKIIKKNSEIDKIDILFIGSLNNRREKILNTLEEYSKKNKLDYKIKLVTNIFNNELVELINKSKLLINIHYYDNALLEIFRINDILSINPHIKIISENPGTNQEQYLIKKYDSLVSFFPIIENNLSNILVMFEIIKKNLNSYNNHNDRMNNINKFIRTNIF